MKLFLIVKTSRKIFEIFSKAFKTSPLKKLRYLF